MLEYLKHVLENEPLYTSFMSFNVSLGLAASDSAKECQLLTRVFLALRNTAKNHAEASGLSYVRSYETALFSVGTKLGVDLRNDQQVVQMACRIVSKYCFQFYYLFF